jgi:DnaK suppressor protein
VTTIANVKLREYRSRERYDESRSKIHRRLPQAGDPEVLAFASHQPDVKDWNEANHLKDIDFAQYSLELQELRGIDAALLRIRGRTYGLCEECSDTISSARLDVNPYIKRCIYCQHIFGFLSPGQNLASAHFANI